MPINRRNLVNSKTEQWRPPLFGSNNTFKDRIISSARRFFDLQAGSIWKDMSILLPEQKGKILDVGCGAQPFRPLLGKDTIYTGLDTNDAKAHFGYEIPDTVYYDGDKVPFDNETFDVVLCTETMEHVLDCSRFVSELNRVLRPGGTLLATVPFSARWHFIPYDYFRYTPSSLNHLLSEASFENVKVYARGNEVTVACYKVMALFLPLIFTPPPSFIAKWLCRLIGLIFVPLIIVLAIIANASFSFTSGGDDCLGYTIIANKS